MKAQQRYFFKKLKNISFFLRHYFELGVQLFAARRDRGILIVIEPFCNWAEPEQSYMQCVIPAPQYRCCSWPCVATRSTLRCPVQRSRRHPHRAATALATGRATIAARRPTTVVTTLSTRSDSGRRKSAAAQKRVSKRVSSGVRGGPWLMQTGPMSSGITRNSGTQANTFSSRALSP